jgi:hypothetical protein
VQVSEAWAGLGMPENDIMELDMFCAVVLKN